MERGSLLRWLFMGLAVFLFVTYGWPLISGEKQSGVPSELQPLGAFLDDPKQFERVPQQGQEDDATGTDTENQNMDTHAAEQQLDRRDGAGGREANGREALQIGRAALQR